MTLLAALLVLLAEVTTGFVLPRSSQQPFPSFALQAKKQKGKATGKGFGKVEEGDTSPQAAATIDSSTSSGAGSALKSVEGGSNAIPTAQAFLQVDENVPVEERTASILRDAYGLRTRDEQDAEAKRQKADKDQKKKLAEWKKQADLGRDFDIMAILPGPVLIGIDYFLKAGTAICTLLFVLAGVGITFEAWSKASNSPLPPDIDAFIVNIVEPNFTPGLLVLLGFSVSLGGYAALQLSSASSTYREDR